MSDAAKLRFTLGSGTPATSPPLAVQIRDSTLTVRASGLTDQQLEVPPGRYYVTARMPDGTQPVLAGPFEAAAGQDREVPLFWLHMLAATPRVIGDAPTALVVNWRNALNRTAGPTLASDAALAGGIAKVPPIPKTAVGSLWHGRWLESWLERKSLSAGVGGVAEGTPLSIFPVQGDDAFIAVPNASGTAATFFAIPFDGPGGHTTIATLRKESTASEVSESRANDEPRYRLDFEFTNASVNSLLRYVRGTLFEEASEYSHRTADIAREVVDEKQRSWLGAIVGCYVLLRLNQLADFDLYTQNLLRLAPSVPDVLALRVEYLARIGVHDRAAAELLRLEQVGVPWSRSGIFYLLDRARTYARGGAKISARQQSQLALYARALDSLAGYVDNDQTIATYRDVPITDNN